MASEGQQFAALGLDSAAELVHGGINQVAAHLDGLAPHHLRHQLATQKAAQGEYAVLVLGLFLLLPGLQSGPGRAIRPSLGFEAVARGAQGVFAQLGQQRRRVFYARQQPAQAGRCRCSVKFHPSHGVTPWNGTSATDHGQARIQSRGQCLQARSPRAGRLGCSGR